MAELPQSRPLLLGAEPGRTFQSTLEFVHALQVLLDPASRMRPAQPSVHQLDALEREICRYRRAPAQYLLDLPTP
jgi:hypothetical protein